MDSVAAKFHEEPGVFKLMVCTNWKITIYWKLVIILKLAPQTSKIKGQIFFGSVPTMFGVSSLPDNRLNNGII